MNRNGLEPWHLIVLVVLVVPLVLWVMSRVSVLRYSDAQWAATGRSRVAYILLIIFLGLLGSLLYALIARPKLKATALPASGPAGRTRLRYGSVQRSRGAG